MRDDPPSSSANTHEAGAAGDGSVAESSAHHPRWLEDRISPKGVCFAKYLPLSERARGCILEDALSEYEKSIRESIAQNLAFLRQIGLA